MFFTRNELQLLRKTKIDAGDFTNYAPNILEAQAEAFTINECGRSNHSKVNAKQTASYKDVLHSIFFIMNNTSFNIKDIISIISKHISI